MIIEINKDSTKNHYHTDPKLIEQINCQHTLFIGSPVYMDSNGFYQLACANSKTTAYVHGIVYGFKGQNHFYLKCNYGHLTYRFPLTPNYFNKDSNNLPIETSTNPYYLPGSPGDTLWLSEKIPGRMVTTSPTGENSVGSIVGYKTQNGFIFQPKILI